MPRNGSGTYSRAVTPPNNGDVADADDFNDEMDDIATALSNSLAKNGETTPTADQPMGGFVLTGLGAGEANGESVRYQQVNKLIDLQAIADPNADSLVVWNDTAGAYAYRAYSAFSGFLFGLTLSNSVSDATNDIDIAAGIAIDSTNAKFLNLASALTKRLDATWAVGSGNGGLDTGSIANTTYHIWLIMRSDTGVVDALFSTSASSPTMPANYDYKRRIGSIIRSAGAILLFFQDGDHFRLATSIADRSSTSAVAISTLTLTVPAGIVVWPIIHQNQVQGTAGSSFTELADGTWTTDPFAVTIVKSANEAAFAQVYGTIRSDTSSRIRIAVTIGSGTINANITSTLGWIDKRGRI